MKRFYLLLVPVFCPLPILCASALEAPAPPPLSLNLVLPSQWPDESRTASYDVAVAEPYAVVGLAATSEGGGLLVLDISNPTKPVRVSKFPLEHSASLVAISGSVVLVTETTNGLKLISMENPAELRLLGSTSRSAFPRDIAVSGHHVYIADAQLGLLVIDIADPTNPIEVTSIPISGNPSGLATRGNLLCVSSSVYGLATFDLSDPGHPTQLGLYPAEGGCVRVGLVGQYAYVSDMYPAGSTGSIGAAVIDITDPAHPQLVGTYPIGFIAEQLVALGGNVFLAEFGGGFHVLEPGENGLPTQVAYLELGDVFQLEAANHYVYAVDNQGLKILDVADPKTPQMVGSYETYAYATELAVRGNELYVADTTGFQAIDIADPLHPRELGRLSMYASAVDLQGDRAYVAGNALTVVDISSPSALRVIGTVPSIEYALDVSVQGNYAYVANSVRGMKVVDISDPANPQVVGQHETFGLVRDVKVAGGLAFLIDSDGFQVLSVAIPTQPQFLGGYSTAEEPNDLAIAGAYVFLAAGENGLEIVDVTQPSQPTPKGHYGTGRFAYGVSVRDQHLFVVQGDFTGPGHIEVLDISDPTNPFLVSKTTTRGEARAVLVQGDKILVADGQSGVRIFSSLGYAQCWLRVGGGAPDTSYTIEAALNLSSPVEWTPLLTTNSPVVPFDVVDHDASRGQKLYRVRQP